MIKMNKTNKKRSRRILLIVFMVLIIALVSLSVMVLAEDCPDEVNLGNLSLRVKGRSEIPRSGKAEMCVNYPEIKYITDNYSNYCGYTQMYTSIKMKGKGDSIDSVKKDIRNLALNFLRCRNLSGKSFSELGKSPGPIEIKETIQIQENQIIHNAELGYRTEVDCTKPEDIENNKTCYTREKIPLFCQKPRSQSQTVSATKKADGDIRKLYNYFSGKIYELTKEWMDDDFKEDLIDTWSSTDCCDTGTFTADCNEDSDCNTIYVGDQFCQGRHIAQNISIPICIDGGTPSARCLDPDDPNDDDKWFESVEILEYCELNESCQAAVCESPSSCTKEGGIDYSTQGTAFTDIYNFKDDCEDSEFLIEYGCQGSALVYEYVNCTAEGYDMCDNTNGAACVQYEAGGKSTEDMIKHSNKYYRGEVSKDSLKKALKQRKEKNDDQVKPCFKPQN